jgi:hypothetical protein
MCPSYSCCHRRRAGALSTPFYWLARLRLASGTDELLPGERPVLANREAALWARLRRTVRRFRRPAGRPTGCARALAERRLAALLGRACCRRALRRAVPLPEALGPLALLAWADETTPGTHWERLWHGLGDT